MISTEEELVVRSKVVQLADSYLESTLDAWEDQKDEYARGVAATGDVNYYVEPKSGFATHEDELIVLQKAAERAWDKATTMTDLFGNILVPENFDLDVYVLLSRMIDPAQDELFGDENTSGVPIKKPVDMYDLFRKMNSRKDPELVITPDIDSIGNRIVYARVTHLTDKVLMVQTQDKYYFGNFKKDGFDRYEILAEKSLAFVRWKFETTMSLLFPFSYIHSDIDLNTQATGSYVMSKDNLPLDARWAFYPVLHKFFKDKVVTTTGSNGASTSDCDYFVEDIEFMVDALVKAYAHFFWYSSHLLVDEGLLRFPTAAIEGVEVNKSLFFDGVFDQVTTPSAKSAVNSLSFSVYALLHVGLALTDLIPLIRPVKSVKLLTTTIRQVGKSSFWRSWNSLKTKMPKWLKNLIPVSLFAASYPIEATLQKKRKAVVNPGTLTLDFQDVFFGLTKEQYVAGVLNEGE